MIKGHHPASPLAAVCALQLPGPRPAQTRSLPSTWHEEQLEVQPGWCWIPNARSRTNLISYLLEAETDDNLVTWGWTDHVLEVRPGTVEEAAAEMLEGRDPWVISPEQLQRVGERVEQRLSERQRVPMLRVTEQHPLPVTRVQPSNQYQRARFALSH